MADRDRPRQRQAVVRSRVETLPGPPQDREKRRPEQTDTLCAPSGPTSPIGGRGYPRREPGTELERISSDCAAAPGDDHAARRLSTWLSE